MPLATKLRYLFVANFEDGESLAQNEKDVSVVNPLRSNYWDLLQEIQNGRKLESFYLNDLEGNPILAVDLKTGLFSYNGTLINAQPSAKPMPIGGHYELIFYRDHKATITGIEVTDVHVYRVGWHYHCQGQTWTQSIVIE